MTIGFLAIALLFIVGSATAQETATFTIGGLAITVRLADEVEAGYDRDDWRHWDERVGGGCFTVRDKVLAEESYVPVVTATGSGGRCRVTSGMWNDPYTAQTFTSADDIQIDHFVPLKEAHDSGGHAWGNARRRLYTNDLTQRDHLIAVHGPENGRKSDKDPADYLPPNDSYKCHYLQTWVITKARWQLAVDARERDAIAQGLLTWCGAN